MNAQSRSILPALFLAAIGLALSTGCDPVGPPMECEPNGQCWALAAGWGDWVEVVKDETVAEMESLDLIEPADPINGAECYEFTFADGHVCAIELSNVLLWGRPRTEVSLPGAEPCSVDGPWDYEIMIGGTCHVVLDGIAFATRNG